MNVRKRNQSVRRCFVWVECVRVEGVSLFRVLV